MWRSKVALAAAALGTLTGAGLSSVRRRTARLQRLQRRGLTAVASAVRGEARVPPPTPPPPCPATPVRVALCQLAVGVDKQRNLVGAEAAIRSAASNGAQLVRRLTTTHARAIVAAAASLCAIHSSLRRVPSNPSLS
jgi:hypothetical protein